MVVNAVRRVVISRKERFFQEDSGKPGRELGIPRVLPQQKEGVAEEPADEEVELIEAEEVDAAPLPTDGKKEGLEVAGGEGGGD